MGRYLVTGGAGFIGSHLVDSLISDGHSVRILDDVSTGRIENVPAEADLVVGDVSEVRTVERVVQDIDGCFHLAAIASVERCREEWSRSHAVNLGGTIAVFEAVSRAQAQPHRNIPVVYASSAAVYGNTCEMPVCEATAARPTNAYGLDKLACEMHAQIGLALHGVHSVGLRFFNVYGPRQDPGSPYSGVISLFCRRLLEGLPLEIYGDGEQVRDFIYVQDVVRALRKAMDTAGLGSGVFNICTGMGTSITRLGKLLSEIHGDAFKAVFQENRPGDIRKSIGDPRLAWEYLDFAAQTKLCFGLMRTIETLALEAGKEECVVASRGLGPKAE